MDELQNSESGDNRSPVVPTPDVNLPLSHESFWQEFWQDKKLLYLTAGVLLFVLATGSLIYYYLFGRETPPPQPELTFTVSAPDKVASDNEFEFTYNFTNTSEHILQDVTMSLDYPQSFTFVSAEPSPESDTGRSYDLGEVGVDSSRATKIKGKFSGQIGDRRDIGAELRYKISGYSQVYSQGVNFTAEVVAADLVLSLIGSSEVTVGQEVIYTIAYRNITSSVLSDINVILTTPSDFRIISSTPSLEEQKIWSLPEISPGFEGTLKVTGVYTTAAAFERVLEVTAVKQTPEGGDELISRASIVTDVSNPPIVVTQTLTGDTDKIVLPGENLRFHLDVENRSGQSLTNLVLSTDLLGNGFKLSSLKTTGGILTGRTVTWTPGGVNELRLLRPGGVVSVEFNLDVADPATTIGERSMIVTSQPRVTSFELKEPILGPDVALKIKTQVDLHQDLIVASGSWPMRVGATTNFRVNWTITNTTNIVQNARVTADLTLGPNSYSNGQASEGTTITGNSGSSLVEWNLNNLEPHSQKTASFLIVYTPSSADVGQSPNILDNVNIFGTDGFTLQQVFDDTPVGPAKPKGSVQP